MSSFEDVESKYNAILRKLDSLRLRGVKDNDPEMLRTKTMLRDLLEFKKKNSTAIQKVVPRLTGIKTLTIKDDAPKSTSLGAVVDFSDAVEVLQNKYVMLGVVLGVGALLYFYFKKTSNPT